MWACFMHINCDPAYLMFVVKRITVRMLEITPQIVNALDVNVTYVQPYSRTTYANNVQFSKFDAGTTSILNIGYPSKSRGNFTLEKA